MRRIARSSSRNTWNCAKLQNPQLSASKIHLHVETIFRIYICHIWSSLFIYFFVSKKNEAFKTIKCKLFVGTKEKKFYWNLYQNLFKLSPKLFVLKKLYTSTNESKKYLKSCLFNMSAEKDLKININRKIKDIAFFPNISWTMSND